MNLAGGSEITLNALIDLVGELAGTTVKIDDQPARAGDAFRNGGSTERARTLLGWEPHVALRDGIAAQLEWHAANVRR
jgi:nucleoside-diphosphate-sugar epimerase